VSSFFEELDHQSSPIGDISLRRKRVAILGGQEVYEVKLGEAFLMTSMFHAVEDAVSHLALRELGAGSWDVVVGGLGLGYTAVAALAHPTVRSLLVIELLEAVIGWHRSGLVPLGAQLFGDVRCRIRQADFVERSLSGEGYEEGRQFHAILLDIDHSPRHLLDAANAALYSARGLAALARHLRPGGVFSMWSDDPPDAAFLELLLGAFAVARAEIVTFPNPLLDRESASTVYVARKAAARETIARAAE
jgi:spermidine synthase